MGYRYHLSYVSKDFYHDIKNLTLNDLKSKLNTKGDDLYIFDLVNEYISINYIPKDLEDKFGSTIFNKKEVVKYLRDNDFKFFECSKLGFEYLIKFVQDETLSVFRKKLKVIKENPKLALDQWERYLDNKISRYCLFLLDKPQKRHA